MTADELIEGWLDGSLDDAGCAELARQVHADPALAARLADEARTHLALRQAFGRRPDLVAGVMAGLRGTESRLRLRQAVMRDLPRRRAARGGAWRWPALAAAAALAVLIGVLATVSGRRPAAADAPAAMPDPAAAPVAAALGTLAEAGDGTVVRRGGRSLTGLPGAVLCAGDAVAAPAGVRTVVAACGARLDLSGGGELTLVSQESLNVAAGSLRAEVAPRTGGPPLVLSTPHATATVLGTVLSLEVGIGRTRLAVERGRVAFAGLGRSATVMVEAGAAAVVRSGADPVPEPAAGAPLFPAGLDGWTRERGTWTWRDGVVAGGSPDGRSRLESQESHDRFLLTCRVRVADCLAAEIQADDYGWFIDVPGDGAWHEVRIRRSGQERAATVDGRPAAIRSEVEGGLARAGGRIAFYVRPGGTIEIADARFAAVP